MWVRENKIRENAYQDSPADTNKTTQLSVVKC